MRGTIADVELAEYTRIIVKALDDGRAFEDLSDEENVTAKFIALQDARDKLSAAALDEVRREKLEAELKRFWRLHRNRILADVNTAGAFATSTKNIGDREQLRQIYYDSIINGNTLRETFERLLQAFSPKRMFWALRTLRNAIAEDMSARTSIEDIARLEAGARHLEQVASINSIRLHALDLGQKLDSPLLKEEDKVFEFLRNVLRFTESSGGNKRFGMLCEEAVGENRADSPEVRRTMRKFLREKIPAWAWSDPEAREGFG